MLQIKNFNIWARKSDCNHIFYTQAYFFFFFFDLGLRQSIHFCRLLSQNLLASIFDKTWLKRDLAFDVVVIFIYYKMINLDSIRNQKKKNTMKNDHIF